MLIEIESHDVVFLEILDLSLLIDHFALFVLELLLCDNPVVVKSLPLLLEIGQKFLFFFIVLLELSQLLSKV